MGRIFAGVSRAGAASRRPYGEKLDCGKLSRWSHPQFENSAAIGFALSSGHLCAIDLS
jgi:hypothetical protein